jgi:hypothetical protein
MDNERRDEGKMIPSSKLLGLLEAHEISSDSKTLKISRPIGDAMATVGIFKKRKVLFNGARKLISATIFVYCNSMFRYSKLVNPWRKSGSILALMVKLRRESIFWRRGGKESTSELAGIETSSNPDKGSLLNRSAHDSALKSLLEGDSPIEIELVNCLRYGRERDGIVPAAFPHEFVK